MHDPGTCELCGRELAVGFLGTVCAVCRQEFQELKEQHLAQQEGNADAANETVLAADPPESRAEEVSAAPESEASFERPCRSNPREPQPPSNRKRRPSSLVPVIVILALVFLAWFTFSMISIESSSKQQLEDQIRQNREELREYAEEAAQKALEPKFYVGDVVTLDAGMGPQLNLKVDGKQELHALVAYDEDSFIEMMRLSNAGDRAGLWTMVANRKILPVSALDYTKAKIISIYTFSVPGSRQSRSKYMYEIRIDKCWDTVWAYEESLHK